MIELSKVILVTMKYVNDKIMPRLDSVRRYSLGVYMMLLRINNPENVVISILERPFFNILNIRTSDNKIDIDKLYEAMHEQMSTQKKIEFSIPMFGNFSFDDEDLKDLYGTIINQ